MFVSLFVFALFRARVLSSLLPFFQFVAHPYSQLMLNSVIYHEIGKLEMHNFFTRLLAGLLLITVLPLVILSYLFVSKSELGEVPKKPFFKFVFHSGSFLWFLIMLILSSIQDKFSNALEFSVLGKYVFVCVF